VSDIPQQERRWTVFISWSGEASLGVARVLRTWLRPLVQSLDPWISPEIAAGERWQSALGQALAETKYGILCVTPDNLHAPWLVFEAGVMARTLGQSRVVPLLFGVTATDMTGPLSQFQSIVGDKNGILKLVKELHGTTDSRMSESEVQQLFEMLWPKISAGIEEAQRDAVSQQPRVQRPDRDVLDEILEAVRGLRVAPSEQGITAALRALQTQLENDLAQLEKQEAVLTASDAPISLEDRAIDPLRRHLERVRTAVRALDSQQSHVSAATTSIVWLGDLLTALERLESDLQGREYALELRSSTDNPLSERIQNEMRLAARLTEFMVSDLRIQAKAS
jgi:hypothetical protein